MEWYNLSQILKDKKVLSQWDNKSDFPDGDITF